MAHAHGAVCSAALAKEGGKDLAGKRASDSVSARRERRARAVLVDCGDDATTLARVRSDFRRDVSGDGCESDGSADREQGAFCAGGDGLLVESAGHGEAAASALVEVGGVSQDPKADAFVAVEPVVTLAGGASAQLRERHPGG